MLDPQPMVYKLREHLPIAREGRDPEGVHQLRVVSRRLRVFLELSGMRVLEDDLRWFRDAAQQARDIDVVQQSSPPEPFGSWLETQRAPARRRMLEALDDPRAKGLLEALSLLPPGDEATARRAMAEIAEKVKKRAAVLYDEHAELEDLHRLRRGVRRLRYALEWLDENAKPVKKVQDALGELGDVRATFELLDEFPRASELEAYRRELWEHALGCRGRALEAWQAVEQDVREMAK
ncbi:MAG: CHAD domain-containing protein [Polyangiales bacterium]